MSALFISHSSADNAIAAQLRAWLAGNGHRSVFLDFDPAQGIPAGRQWEQELYTQLRACQAMIVLCSAQSMASAWCFAEITHARALGKPVFPLKVGDCTISPLLGDVQITDMTHDPAQGYQRLFAGLAAAGLDPAGHFDWDGSRPPYPGLLAFQKADAAVYFGRDAAIQSTIETLHRLQRLGGARLVLVLGASGSGKSSLMRAGVVPRLEREPGRWLAVEPFRPLVQPFDALSLALASLRGAPDWKDIRTALRADDAHAPWRDLVNDLRLRAGHTDASMLLVIDQFEELLGQATDDNAAFLRLLRTLTATPGEPLIVVATLRSDFLGAFQTHPMLQGVLYEPIHLPQIARADLASVIEGPARVAGIELGAGLAQAMVADTTTDDALPLLAFTLRELWDRFGAGRQLRLSQYRVDLGGLQGALARAAEGACAEAALSSTEMEALRKALLRLVRVDAEGRFVRQPRLWAELSTSVHPLLERFVQARLLVSRAEGHERVLEVAHEALFRSWNRLVGWINADREFLLWQERLRGDCAEWQRNARDTSLTLRGPVLVEAQRWLSGRGDDLDAETREFIELSIDARQREQATRDRLRRNTYIGLTLMMLFFGVLAALAGWQWHTANQQRQLALARQLNAEADVAQAEDPVLSLLLTVQSLRSAWTAEAHDALLQRIDGLARAHPSPWQPHPGAIRAMALSPDRRWLATAGQGHLQVQGPSGAVHVLSSQNHHGSIHALGFSPGGEWLAASCKEPAVCIYDTGTWQPVKEFAPTKGVITAVSFSRDGKLLAFSSREEPAARLHAVPGWDEQGTVGESSFGVHALAFSPTEDRLAFSTNDSIDLWQTTTRTRLAETAGGGSMSMAFGRDGKLLGASSGSTFRLLEVADDAQGRVQLTESLPARMKASPFGRVGFSEDRRYFALSDDHAGVRMAEVERGGGVVLGAQPAGALAFAPGPRVIAGNIDGRIVEWQPNDKPLRRIVAGAIVHALALSPDSSRLAMASDGDLLRVFDSSDGRELHRLQLAAEPQGLAFSPDGRWLIVVAGTQLRLLDTTSWQIVGPFKHEGTVAQVAFGNNGAVLATSTAWERRPEPELGYAIWLPPRIAVWDIQTGSETGWTFDAPNDFRLPRGANAQASMAALKATKGGDTALVASAASWPASYRHDRDVGPSVLWPEHTWLSARSNRGTTLAEGAVRRATAGHGAEDGAPLLAVGAHGKLLASAAGGEALLWPLMTDDLIADTCARTQRNLSCEQWRKALGNEPYMKTCPLLPDPPDLPNCRDGGASPEAQAKVK